MVEPHLVEQAEEFAGLVSSVLSGSLPNAPEARAKIVRNRVVIDVPAIDLYVGGKALATLSVGYFCQLDSRGRWLAIQESYFRLSAKLDRTPIVRFEYLRVQQGGHPAAHVQVHAHRGALSHLLSQAGHQMAHDMSGLHIPVGGVRFRPCLEDLLEFLIVECKFDAQHGWRAAIGEGRERWRRTQVRAAVRDAPEEAIAVLEECGYQVTGSASGPPRESRDHNPTLHRW